MTIERSGLSLMFSYQCLNGLRSQMRNSQRHGNNIVLPNGLECDFSRPPPPPPVLFHRIQSSARLGSQILSRTFAITEFQLCLSLSLCGLPLPSKAADGAIEFVQRKLGAKD